MRLIKAMIGVAICIMVVIAVKSLFVLNKGDTVQPEPVAEQVAVEPEQQDEPQVVVETNQDVSSEELGTSVIVTAAFTPRFTDNPTISPAPSTNAVSSK